MKIVKFNEVDTEEIVSLFYETIHSINVKDYSQIELDVWAPKEEKESKINSWKVSLSQNVSFVAKVHHKIVGLTHQGHLDRLYVHKDYQGKGIATALVDKIESEAKKLNLLEIDTDASITAKPFFEHKGYKIVCSQTVERKGVKLTNFKMVKKIKL
ncbi:GNAT family N-acetyltransferase [Bacillus cereus]|uniref:GNAT family N-acetyltransferase n=1 Tax=Bacillus cereus TaxID=1396 RepID=UPI000BF798DA|nr:GNAT family N-acetyltransferase [Bacillus cereus]PFA17662.1 GNAT family N-acetyltransferase [Bacillus cereus]PGZ16258.1 GNAT family N-acetyltransferase [Bacillus cereus]